MGRYIESAVEFGREPNLAAPYFGGSFLGRRPDSSGGGLPLPPVESGRIRSVPPDDFSGCAAAALGDSRYGSISDPKKIITKLHANWDMRRRLS